MTLKKLFPILGATLLIAALFAFRKHEISVEVNGQVYHKDNALPSVEVFVLKDDGVKTPYYEPTAGNGRYSLRFNAVEGKPVELLYYKKGYSPLKTTVTLSGNERKVDLPAVHLVQTLNTQTSGQPDAVMIQYNGNPPKESLPVYWKKDFQSAGFFDPSQIDYFRFIRLEDKDPSNNGYWHRVNFLLKNQSDPIKGWIFQ